MKRPFLANVVLTGPFQVRVHQVTLKPLDRKPGAPSPVVRIAGLRAAPETDDPGLQALVRRAGLGDRNNDGLKERNTDRKTMWLGDWSAGLRLEFELPQTMPLAAMEVWNYNDPWEMTNGVLRADVAVSEDGQQWKTLAQGVSFGLAEGSADYDEPTVIDLKGTSARKVRLENIVPCGSSGKVGLSGVLFHETVGAWASGLFPEDGQRNVSQLKRTLTWSRGWGAVEHRVFFGTDPEKLSALGTTKETQLTAPEFKLGTTYYWRVDEVQANGKVLTGRVLQFETQKPRGE